MGCNKGFYLKTAAVPKERQEGAKRKSFGAPIFVLLRFHLWSSEFVVDEFGSITFLTFRFCGKKKGLESRGGFFENRELNLFSTGSMRSTRTRSVSML